MVLVDIMAVIHTGHLEFDKGRHVSGIGTRFLHSMCSLFHETYGSNFIFLDDNAPVLKTVDELMNVVIPRVDMDSGVNGARRRHENHVAVRSNHRPY
ncbi:hypothetical protein TNCV_4036801 [Trichonephila clavipes]|nr:hypothetical protein TNCV_4036801 [Trichonephila clavipes]